MKSSLGMILLLVFSLTLSTQTVFAGNCILSDPFYGTLTVNGQPAAIGTEIRGMVNGVEKGTYTTTVQGQYGQQQGQDKLYVACPTDNDIINFEVKVDNNWVDSGETANCNCGLDIRNLDISANFQCQPSQEVCDGADNDCDDLIDEGVQTTFYQDSDSDTYGNALVNQQACQAPQGYVANDDDCNDNDNTVYPGAPELADGKDNDCDGTTDEGTNAYDDDGDGFSENQGDCNDNNPNINPNADDDCDGINNDCDQNTPDGSDDPAIGQETFCGIGQCASEGITVCQGGFIVDTCQAGQPVPEQCDGLDNDCVDGIDNGVLLTFFQDSDIDTYGSPIVTQDACNPPQGYVNDNTDCDDTNVNVNPGAPEDCDNGIDDDCDLLTDENDPECACTDSDQDTVCDFEDECPNSNDLSDADSDGVPDGCDNCPSVSNADQADLDDDGIGDACDNDDDGDGFNDDADNCPNIENADQTDSDQDGFGDVCDPDDDNDGIDDEEDACPGFDDLSDADSDGVPDGCDNCPDTPNAEQADLDNDGIGSACDGNEETFEASITFYDGWTLFGLPFKPIGVDDTEELGQAIMDATGIECDVIMRYNGATQQMEDDILGLADPSFILNGVDGYFIHCDSTATYNFEGTIWV